MSDSLPFEFNYTIAMRDTDAAGVLFSANLISICHLAYEAMMTSIGFNLGPLLEHRRFGLPLAHVEGDFRRRLALGDEVVIRARVAELGRTSYRIAYEIVNQAGEVCATAATVHVCVEMKTYQPKRIPDDLRAALRKYL